MIFTQMFLTINIQRQNVLNELFFIAVVLFLSSGVFILRTHAFPCQSNLRVSPNFSTHGTRKRYETLRLKQRSCLAQLS